MKKLDNSRTTYFPAVSVGSYMSLITKNTKHFKNGKSYRYYSDKEDPLFYYPYMLTSAAHNFKDMNFRETIAFPRDSKGLFFADSGGYQLLTGKAPKGFSREISFAWMEKNADVFPLLDMPFPKNYTAVTNDYFNKSVEFTKESARYFLNTRTNNDSIILNVLQGRDLAEIEKWYAELKQFQFEGWAFGGYNLTQIMGAFFYLFENKEIDKTKIFHIFMLSKARYMIFLVYLQYLLHKESHQTVISYDSSYPVIQSAFGNYFLYSTLTGFKTIRFSNRYDYSFLKDENVIPCECNSCQGVPLKEFTSFTTDRFYAITSAHNIKIITDYKKMLEHVIAMGSMELYEGVFSSEDISVLKIIEKAFKNRYVKGNYRQVYKDLLPFVNNELDEDSTNSKEDFLSYF